MELRDVGSKDDSPQLRHALPLRKEERWSDMLAVLAETDPIPLCALVGVDVDPSDVTIHREVAIDRANRPDLLVRHRGSTIMVIEVKVLAGLGRSQLARYVQAEPRSAHYLLIYPGRLTIDTSSSEPWCGVTWEEVLDSYSTSRNSWVRATAAAWAHHLDHSLPAVDGMTIWNALEGGEDFVLAMRTRMAWLDRKLRPNTADIDHDLVGSSLGVSWVVRLFANATAPGYQIMVEIEERLPVRLYPPFASPDSRRPIGPSIKIALMQTGVITSANFDWHYLYAMWPHMQAARTDWVTNRARPKNEHDRAGWQSIVALGAPKYLGIGFGEAQTRINRTCMFGARIQLPPTHKLDQILAELHNIESLMHTMSQVPPPECSG